MSNELPSTVHMGTAGVDLRSLDDLFRFGKLVCNSGLAPSSYREPAQVMVAVQMGLEVGLAPMQALQSIAVINGRPSLWGDGARAVILRSGLLEDQQEELAGQGDAREAVVRLKRRGVQSWFEGRFSVADAKRASLWGKKGPWTDYPEVMLLNRARAFAQRRGFADALRGLAIADEVQDWREIEPSAPRAVDFEEKSRRDEHVIESLMPVHDEDAPAPAREEEPAEPEEDAAASDDPFAGWDQPGKES